MNYQVVRSIFADTVFFRKKKSITKLLVLAVSISFVSLNSAVSYAQMTMDGSTMTDGGMDADDDTTTATDDTMTEADDTIVDDSSTVVDLIEDTVPEETPEPAPEPEPEPEPEGGGGGGGGAGGAIVALVAVGAVVLLVTNSSKKKEPKIQKTFLSDQVSGIGTELIEISNQSSFLEQAAQPSFSFQYGTYQSFTGFDKPYSFLNLRYQKSLSSSLNFSADAGTRYFSQSSGQLDDSQWLSLGLSSTNLLAKHDRLAFTARYSTGDVEENSDSFSLNSNALESYDAIFSDQNAQFELAYSFSLGQNQRLRFLMQKINQSTEEYAAKLAWRYAF